MKLLDVGCGAGRLAVPAVEWVGDTGAVTVLGRVEIRASKVSFLGERVASAAVFPRM